jgi:RNA polymerase sigma-70 factor, ECF subfamily
VQRTDNERLEEIHRRHFDAVTAYVRRRAPADVVDDVVAETFLVCWRRIDRVPEAALPWLYAVARNTLANERRKRARTAPAVSPIAISEPQPAEDAGLVAAFAGLSERDREVLCLVAWEGLALREAASVLGCSAVACRVRFHRARRRLAARLANVEADDRSHQPQPCPDSQGATP